MPEPTPFDVVRTRYPQAPDADAAGLWAHAEYLNGLRDRIDAERLRGVEPATTFDPRSERE